MTMYALIDCNNFYASCHRIFQPTLTGQPIVVLSNQDGCVIARSDEAKALNIPMGAVYFEYKNILEKEKVHVFSAKFSLYGDMSNRVMTILKEYSPEVELYSIDEIFLKLTGFNEYDLQDYALRMKKQVEQWTGIPISVGIGPTKSLAKTANKIAKKFKKQTTGVYVIDTDELKWKVLKWQKVEDIWGIGSQFHKFLKSHNVITALDFVNLPEAFVQKHLSVVGKRLQRDLKGIETLFLEEQKPKKNIATTRSFDRNYTKYQEVKERIITFTIIAAERLRMQKSVCKSISVFVRTNRHRKELQQYNNGYEVHLPFETNSTLELIKYAITALDKIYCDGYAYKKAGVILHDIVSEENYQYSLFTQRDERHVKLMQVIDKINLNSPNKIKFGGQDLTSVWKMRQTNLCPSYTTNINDIIEVK
jgi:DNA polymerase V